MLEANEPMNIVRKSGYDSAALALPGRWPCCGNGVVAVAVMLVSRLAQSYAGNTRGRRGVIAGMEISEALDFVATRQNGVLATQKRDGRPQLSNITYGVVDGVIKISITAGRAKYFNLLRDRRASLYVTREDFWGYVVLDGDATMSEIATKPDDPGADELVEYYRAIAGEHPDWDDYRKVMVSDKRVVVRLQPTHAYGMLNR
jgi:PPOX class probable F420-dependent enzyme